MKQYSKYIYIIFLIVAPAMVIGMKSAFVDARTVEGVRGAGKVAIVGITPEQAWDLAKRQARAQAIEQAAGVEVRQSILIRDALLVGQFLETFSRGLIIHEEIVKRVPSFLESTTGPPIPVYELEIVANVMIPERRVHPDFMLEASIDNGSIFISGDHATISVRVTRNAHIAIFNLTANDKVAMLYPTRRLGQAVVLKPGEKFCFPPSNSGFALEISTYKENKSDNEAFMVMAVESKPGGSFRFTDYFSEDKQYDVAEFFAIYGKFAERSIDRILPYEVKKRGK